MNQSTSNPQLQLNLDTSPFEIVPLTDSSNQQAPLSPLPKPPHPLHHHSKHSSISSRTSDFRSEYNKSINHHSDQPLLPPNPIASGSTSTRGSVAFQHPTLDNGDNDSDSLPGLRRPRLRPPKVPQPRLNDLMNEKPNHSDHYCCFAIPLYNTGIYVILAQFTMFGFVAGVLAFAAPSVIAIAVHPSLTAIMGVLFILVGFFQLMGFYGVYKERVKIFRIYLYINVGIVLLTLGYSLVIMILSAQQHDTAIEQCLSQFVSADGDTTETPSNESRTLCNIWTWAQLGVCGVLWILFGLSESYFCFLQRRWSQDQKNDHLKYRSIISAVRESMAVRNSEELERRSESNDVAPRGMNGTVKGGSRLKNEIEWKPIATQPQEEQEITEYKSHDSSASGSGSSDADFYRKNSAVIERKRGDSTMGAPKSILKNSTSRSNLSSAIV